MASGLAKKGWFVCPMRRGSVFYSLLRHLSAEGVGLCGEACGNKDASLEKAALDV